MAILRDVDVFARPESQCDGLVKVGHVGGVGVEKTAAEASNLFGDPPHQRRRAVEGSRQHHNAEEVSGADSRLLDAKSNLSRPSS